MSGVVVHTLNIEEGLARRLARLDIDLNHVETPRCVFACSSQ